MPNCQVATFLMLVILSCSFTGCVSESGNDSQEAETLMDWYPDRPLGAAMVEPREMPAASEKGPWPILAVEEEEHSFGTMETEQSAAHVFVIANHGKSELKIAVGSPTSNVKNVTLSNDVIEPGETASLRLEWFSGRSETEQFIHGVEIYTNDPKTPSQQLAIEGRVVPALQQG